MARRKRTPAENAAIYRRRVERGRAAGKTPSESAGQTKRAKARKQVELPEAGTIVRDTASERTRRMWLRRARDGGRLCGALITVDVPDSDEYHAPGPASRYLDGRAYKYPLNGDVITVQLIIAARGRAGDIFPGGGIDAGYFLDLLEGGAGDLSDWNDVVEAARDEGLF